MDTAAPTPPGKVTGCGPRGVNAGEAASVELEGTTCGDGRGHGASASEEEMASSRSA